MFSKAKDLVIKPHERRKQLPKYPSSIILFHHPHYFKVADEILPRLLKNFRKDSDWVHQTHYRQKYLYRGVPIVLDDARDGARGTMRHLERHYFWGARLVINIGAAGAIDPSLKTGDLVVGDRAIRDNGIDYDLATKKEIAQSNKEISDKIFVLTKKNKTEKRKTIRGTVWTVGHKYYTWKRLKELKNNFQHPVAVDMEMAPFCIMASWLNANYGKQYGTLRVGNLLYISDIIPQTESEKWRDTMSDLKKLIPYKILVLRLALETIASIQQLTAL